MGRHRILTDFYGIPKQLFVRVFAFVELVAGVEFDNDRLCVPAVCW